MTAPAAIPTREDITAAWMILPSFDVGRALAERSAMIVAQAAAAITEPEPEPEFAHCDLCGAAERLDDLPADWNGETGSHLSCEAELDDSLDDPNVCGCDDCLRKEAVR